MQKAPATFSITIPARGAATSQSSRKVQYVAPTTAAVYISLEDTPGHGNATFSFTEQINSTNCTTTSEGEGCSFTAQVPIGTDDFSILTTDANNVPLGYTNGTTTITAGRPERL